MFLQNLFTTGIKETSADAPTDDFSKSLNTVNKADGKTTEFNQTLQKNIQNNNKIQKDAIQSKSNLEVGVSEEKISQGTLETNNQALEQLSPQVEQSTKEQLANPDDFATKSINDDMAKQKAITSNGNVLPEVISRKDASPQVVLPIKNPVADNSQQSVKIDSENISIKPNSVNSSDAITKVLSESQASSATKQPNQITAQVLKEAINTETSTKSVTDNQLQSTKSEQVKIFTENVANNTNSNINRVADVKPEAIKPGTSVKPELTINAETKSDLKDNLLSKNTTDLLAKATIVNQTNQVLPETTIKTENGTSEVKVADRPVVTTQFAPQTQVNKPEAPVLQNAEPKPVQADSKTDIPVNVQTQRSVDVTPGQNPVAGRTAAELASQNTAASQSNRLDIPVPLANPAKESDIKSAKKEQMADNKISLKTTPELAVSTKHTPEVPRAPIARLLGMGVISPAVTTDVTMAATSTNNETYSVARPETSTMTQTSSLSASRELPLPVHVPRNIWNQRFAEHISMLTLKGASQARIKLDPPELGPMMVRIIHGAETQIQFTVNNPVARDLVDSGMQRLRELLEQQGFDQVNVDVREFKQESHADNPDSHDLDDIEIAHLTGESPELSAQAKPIETYRESIGIIDIFA